MNDVNEKLEKLDLFTPQSRLENMRHETKLLNDSNYKIKAIQYLDMAEKQINYGNGAKASSLLKNAQIAIIEGEKSSSNLRPKPKPFLREEAERILQERGKHLTCKEVIDHLIGDAVITDKNYKPDKQASKSLPIPWQDDRQMYETPFNTFRAWISNYKNPKKKKLR